MAQGNRGHGHVTPRQRDLKLMESTQREECYIGKWDYKLKLRASGQVDKYRTNYDAKWFKQQE